MSINFQTTTDYFLGQKLKLEQPKLGYRAGEDAILLCSAIDVKPGARVLDVGCGAGITTLCSAWRFPQASFFGLDKNPELIDLACQNAFSQKIFNAGFKVGCLMDFRDQPYDVILTNPPFYQSGHATPSLNPLRKEAFFRTGTLSDWIERSWDCLSTNGKIYIIYPTLFFDNLLKIVQSLTKDHIVLTFFLKPGKIFARKILCARKTSVLSNKEYLLPPLRQESGQYTSFGNKIFYEGLSLFHDQQISFHKDY